MIRRLLIQFGNEVRKAGGEVTRRARLFRAAGCAARHIDEHHGQTVTAKCIGQTGGALDDFAGGVGGGQRDDTLLQIDDDQCGLCVEGSESHGVFLGVRSR